MKTFKLTFIGLLALSVALTACGGGGDVTSAGAPGPGPVAGTNFDLVLLDGLDPSGTFSAAIAINNSEMAVGVSDDGQGILGARWDLSAAIPTVTALGFLASHNYSAAYGINNSGISVGESGNGAVKAVYWPAGSSTANALSESGLLGDNNTAYSINTNNRIAGEADDGLGHTIAIYWPGLTEAPVALVDLSAEPGSSAYFISNGDIIVGESRNSSGQFQAVAWLPSAGVYGTPVPLAALAGQVASVAFGVDHNGNIVGEAELDTGVVHGMVWNTGGVIVANLGANTSAQAISQGVSPSRIVGYLDALTGNDNTIVWNLSNTADTNTPITPFSQAYGVNGDGFDIVGVNNNSAFALLAQ